MFTISPRSLTTTLGLLALASTARAQFTPYCFGDGTGTICPCSNNGTLGNGCGNSANPGGALLSGTGFASLSSDTVVLTLTGANSATGSRFFQALNWWNGPNGLPIWDGLRCVNSPVIVLKNVPVVGGTAVYPTAADLPVSVRSWMAGITLVAGTTAYYQTRYNDPSTFCTVAPFNMSNGIYTVWVP